MTTRLPQHLSPSRFRSSLAVYSNKYDRCYSIRFGSHDFIVDYDGPFRLWLADGINGEDLEERRQFLNFLRIAYAIHRDHGIWPDLNIEWDDMCPGGVLKLDVTQLITSLEAPLPSILEAISNRIDDCLHSSPVFADAEKHYRDKLKGLAAFNSAVSAIQSEFDAQPVCALAVSTKARRLRYVCVLASLASQINQPRNLSAALGKWAAAHITMLEAYADPRGVIIERTGPSSVKPYLDLGRQLSILVPIGRGLSLSNSGRCLVLLSPVEPDFSISIEERLFFLYEILARDRDIIGPLLASLHATAGKRKRELRKEFPSVYKKHLEGLTESCGTTRSRRIVESALERVRQWKSPETYMEHVIDPRVSWLVDLGLCKLQSDDVTLTHEGNRLVEGLRANEESQTLVITNEYLRRRFFKSIAPWMETASVKPNAIERDTFIALLRVCIEYVREHTKTLAPNRIVASTLFRYTAITLYVRHKIAVDHWDLQNFLQDAKNAKAIGWELRWSASQVDGYLIRSSVSN